MTAIRHEFHGDCWVLEKSTIQLVLGAEGFGFLDFYEKINGEMVRKSIATQYVVFLHMFTRGHKSTKEAIHSI